MEAAAASTEIFVLGWSVVLLLAQILAQAFALDLFGGLKIKYLLGPRDEGRVPNSAIAGRLSRALNNLLETYPAFVALALALAVTGKTGGIAATGASLWLAARVLYVIAYAAGIPVVRTLIWFASILGLVLMLIRLMG